MPKRVRQPPLLEAWERSTALRIGLLLAALICWLFIIHVASIGTMSEYLFKFLPVMTDGGISSIFDGNGIGDPRPRFLTTLLTYLNILLRRAFFLRGVIHPSLGINWALYPLCVFLVQRVVKRLTLDDRAALMAAILYAASPALLDTLVNYYVPAKPLANLMMLLALYGSCLAFPARPGGAAARPILGCSAVFAASLLGLLSDETAVFICVCVPLLFLHKYLDRDTPACSKVMYAAALVGSLGVFALVAFLATPAINLSLGQAPIDYWTVITRGVYREMFLTADKPVGAQISQISPFSLFETILSAHTVPFRFVLQRWTSGNPLLHFYEWRLSDRIGLYAFLTILLVLAWRLRFDVGRRRVIARLSLSFLVFVFGESVLLLRLSPWIVEVNYYAAFSSLFFALIVGVLIAGLAVERASKVAWALVVYFAAVQLVNFYFTAQRHPGIAEPHMSWAALREADRRVRSGNFAEVAKSSPFPSQLFSYGFELEAAIEHSAGRKIDLQPMKNRDSSLLRFIAPDKLQDPNIIHRDTALGSGKMIPVSLPEQPGRDLATSLAGRTIRGSATGWEYVRHIGADGEIGERVWYPGLMRVWSRRGRAVIAGSSFCLSFVSDRELCISRTEQHGDVTFGFAEDGSLLTTFRLLSPEISVPADLADRR